MLRQLTPLQYNCLLFIVAFVKECLTHRENGLTTESAAHVFSGALMRKKAHEDASMYPPGVATITGMPAPTPGEQDAMDAIIMHFITSSKLE
jgi:hypothetical protein